MKHRLSSPSIFGRKLPLAFLLVAGATCITPALASSGHPLDPVRIPTTRLTLSQSASFAILGHSCGGIAQRTYVTGFDPTTGLPTGEVRLTTTCSTGGLGSHPATFTAWAGVTWDFSGNVVSAVALGSALPYDPTFKARDAYGDMIYNLNTYAYLHVPYAGAPVNVNAAQVGDRFQISWTAVGANPAALMSTTLTATPVNSTAPVLTATVTGSAATGSISSLQPQTTYEITLFSTTLSGTGPASTPLYLTTSQATLLPGAPTGVVAHWTNLDPPGATDTLVADWQAADAGDSPIDQYLISITNSDTGGVLTQTVSGTTLTASFTVDWTPNWSVTVKAHNLVGYGPASSVFTLGGL